MPQFQDSLPNSFLEQVTGHQLWYSRVEALLLRCSLKLSIQNNVIKGLLFWSNFQSILNYSKKLSKCLMKPFSSNFHDHS